MRLFHHHQHPILQIAFGADGHAMASVAIRDPVHFWQVGENWGDSAYPNEDRPDFDYGLTCVAFTTDSGIVAVGGKSGLVDIWSRSESRLIQRLPIPYAEFVVTALCYLNRGRYLAVTYSDSENTVGSTRIYDAQKKHQLVREFGTGSFSGGLAAQFNEKTVFFIEGLRRVCKCDLLKADASFTPNFVKPIRRLAINASGTQLAVAHDYAIEILNTVTMQRVMTLAGHKGRVDSLAFLPDGRLLSGGWDKTVRLWDVNSGREQGAHDWDIGGIRAVAVAPDGLLAAAGGDTGAIALWDVDE